MSGPTRSAAPARCTNATRPPRWCLAAPNLHHVDEQGEHLGVVDELGHVDGGHVLSARLDATRRTTPSRASQAPAFPHHGVRKSCRGALPRAAIKAAATSTHASTSCTTCKHSSACKRRARISGASRATTTAALATASATKLPCRSPGGKPRDKHATMRRNKKTLGISRSAAAAAPHGASARAAACSQSVTAGAAPAAPAATRRGARSSAILRARERKDCGDGVDWNVRGNEYGAVGGLRDGGRGYLARERNGVKGHEGWWPS